MKGHQDDNANAELSNEALLNIEADQLPVDFQEQEGTNRKIVLILPCCPTMLDIKGVSITSNLFHHLVREHTQVALLKQIQLEKKLDDDLAAASILWQSLSLVIVHIDQEIVIAKVCNDGILQTMNVLHKTKQSFIKKCPICLNTSESQDLI